jgi:cellulose synthase/poly-beta-1,6-N-acetylglucosamine synthase-like glycosyltransferase
MIYLFWLSIMVILYSYFGYPAILWLLSKMERKKGRGDQVRTDNSLPKVSLLISAYNEERTIEDKILNSLELKYPKELLEIVVVSDGSVDRTDQIVTNYAGKGIILRSYGGRIGKTACINKAVPLARGEIIVFSDANSKYDRNTLRELVKHFEDETIGFVTGFTRYISEKSDGVIDSVSLYSRIELFTKQLESIVGSCVGADGAVFAIRKQLYRELKDTDINDLVIPFMILKQGYKGILEEKASCFEKTAKTARGEFYRQMRITNRTIRAIFNNNDLLNPFRFGIFSFQLFSHKICKLIVPFFLLILLLTNIFLFSHGLFYSFTMFGQFLLYSLSFAESLSSSSGNPSRLLSAARTFTVVNCAILFGWFKFFKGDTYTQWSISR